MEKYCKKLKEWVMKIVNCEMKDMTPLTRDEKKYHDKQNKCSICNKRFYYDKKYKNYTNYKKVHYHCHYSGKYRGAAHSICNLQYGTTKIIPVIFHNGSKYHWHFIIKELAKEFDCGEFKCLAENTEKYISFSAPIKKEYNDGTFEMF